MSSGQTAQKIHNFGTKNSIISIINCTRAFLKTPTPNSECGTEGYATNYKFMLLASIHETYLNDMHGAELCKSRS